MSNVTTEGQLAEYCLDRFFVTPEADTHVQVTDIDTIVEMAGSGTIRGSADPALAGLKRALTDVGSALTKLGDCDLVFIATAMPKETSVREFMSHRDLVKPVLTLGQSASSATTNYDVVLTTNNDVVLEMVSTSMDKILSRVNKVSRLQQAQRRARQRSVLQDILLSLSAIQSKHPKMADQVRDARTLARLLPLNIARPTVWTDGESEVVFEWISGEKHAVVSFEGDGEYGYALRQGHRFVSGSYPGKLDLPAPLDLIQHVGTT